VTSQLQRLVLDFRTGELVAFLNEWADGAWPPAPGASSGRQSGSWTAASARRWMRSSGVGEGGVSGAESRGGFIVMLTNVGAQCWSRCPQT
jgi:hypothetical protein